MGEHIAHRGVKQNHEGKGLLERPRCRWQPIIMDLKRIRYEGMKWIHLVKNNKAITGYYDYDFDYYKSRHFLII